MPKSYHLIISDIVIFVAIYIVSHVISAFFPGTTEDKTTTQYNVQLVETRSCFKKVMLAIYILFFSFLLLSVTYFVNKTNSASFISDNNMKFIITCDELIIDAWLIFWIIALFCYLFEYIFRLMYNRREKTFPISPLLFTIIRTVRFYVTILWLLHYVLKWNPTHLVVSTSVIIAIGGYSLKSLTSDLLAGISLHMTRSVLPSDWIYIPSSKLEGEVSSTNLLATRLRTGGGHMYILRNSYLTTHIFHNLSWPDSIRAHNLKFIVNFKSSPDDVEKALLKAASSNPDVMQSPNPPSVSITAF